MPPPRHNERCDGDSRWLEADRPPVLAVAVLVACFVVMLVCFVLAVAGALGADEWGAGEVIGIGMVLVLIAVGVVLLLS